MPGPILGVVLLDDRAVQIEIKLPGRRRRTDSPQSVQNGRATREAIGPRIPRITRLMALAIKFQAMVDSGELNDYADIARLGYVTRARMTQIMNLLLLAPDIQEHILGLPETSRETSISERQLRELVGNVSWELQRFVWADLKRAPTRNGVALRNRPQS